MIIGIGGVSTSGKTTLAGKIRSSFPGKRVSILCQDNFIRNIDQIPLIKDRINWEHPDSIDHEKLYNAILSEKGQNDIVIAEGLLIFYHQPTQRLFDIKLYLEIAYPTFLHRKKQDLRWGGEPQWYIMHIWNSFLQYGKLPADRSDFHVFDGSLPVTSETIHQLIQP
ncbi:MAG: hypothetical protein KKD74_11770 [Bacteroidetes bacterium]|nr:hypothetical protein [Bacteroidales bacterium]MBU1010802.1 hypothetical protein [Bacteroidota bacterium]